LVLEFVTMAHSYLDYSPDQPYLLPPDPRDWLPEGHLAYLILDLVPELDMTSFDTRYSKDGRGAPAFDPRMMVGLFLYCWAHRVYSSRKIARYHRSDLGARVLVAEHAPDFRSIHEFQVRHKDPLNDLMKQSVMLCRRAGLASLENVAIDGTKLAANASRASSLTYAQIVEEEKDLAQAISDLQDHALALDAQEDSLFGGDDGSNMPTDLRTRQGRLAKLREAKASLEAEARRGEEKREREWDALGAGDRPHRKAPDPSNAVPKDNATYNMTDPDSRLMKGKRGFLQGYNAQIAVDTKHQVIVGCALTQETVDYGQLQPVLDQVEENTQALPEYVLADAGYYSRRNVEMVEERGCTALIPPESSQRLQHRPLCQPQDDQAVAELPVKERQIHRLSTPDGRKRYGLRFTSAEPVFGQIKGSPGNVGLPQFLRRGLKNCSVQWSCVCATHNILKYLAYST
jgi:transposase